MSERNRSLAMRWFEEVWNQRRTPTVDELLSPEVRAYTEGGLVENPEQFKSARAGLLGAFPDMRVTVEDTVAEGDHVVVRWSAKARHTGEGLGFEASGKEVAFRGLTWLVFRDGRIVGGWDSWNLGKLLDECAPRAGPTERRERRPS